MVNELLNCYIDQSEKHCVQRTRSILDCIESTWMWTHEEPLDMNEVHLFLCDEHSGKLSDEQKEFVRACRNWVQEQLQNQVFIRPLQDEDLRKNVVNFCNEHCKGSVMQIVAEIRPLCRL